MIATKKPKGANFTNLILLAKLGLDGIIIRGTVTQYFPQLLKDGLMIFLIGRNV